MNENMKRLKRERMYKGTVIDVYRDHMKFSNGNTEQWDYIHHRGAAAVLPIMEDGRILMIHQYRNALEQTIIELPAGGLDAYDEEGIHCAARELEEETGYRSENLEWLLTLRTSVALSNEKIEVFVARDLIPSKQHLDPNEFVEVKAYTLDELKQMIFAGEIIDGKTIAAVMTYAAKIQV